MISLLVLSVASLGPGDDPTRVLAAGQKPADRRLAPPKTLNDYFPFAVPASREAWEQRRRQVREQVLVALGLWPMPEKTPLAPVIHGRIDRDEYTIEKVFFASLPGHYVCGNLYRPKGSAGLSGPGGKRPGVLCPHGHWSNGRFYEASEKAAQDQIKQGAEKTIEGARYPLQARCAQLARMGCVVFHYDMVGYADSRWIPHRVGFTDAEAELRLQSFMGLQTWNSIRALDFLLSLPEVDPQRIGVTGASGGGTQTFILTAVDDRPTVAFPAVMVSTAMQGGCVCENASHLRVGTGNVELAGLFAPKPLAMSGADDWTKEIETKGFPELRRLYALYGAEDKVLARAFTQFKHNYNQVAREMMYNWFNNHLKLGWPTPVVEKPFVPVPPKELSVFDEQHPVPKDVVDAAGLRRYWTTTSDRQLAALKPEEFRAVVATALRVMVHDRLPQKEDVEAEAVGDRQEREGVVVRKFLLSRRGEGEKIPAILLTRQDFDGTVVVWVHPAGKSSLVQDGRWLPEVRAILDRKAAILAVDVFGTGEYGSATIPVDAKYAGFTFGYNRSLLAQRVHDILTAITFARSQEKTRSVHLLGLDKAGPWVVLARASAGDAVRRTAADLNQFDFGNVTSTSDEMMLPGALKYGGMAGIVSLLSPGDILLHNHRDFGGPPGERRPGSPPIEPAKAIAWLLR
ncbi:MAG: acetylxylan esterase [Gemmataceae bacterium]|nr:acetylxylan esterase [Gemmataceae bacterium]MDW8266993.1 hypothetical protein [Gemmataceae bacterium]